MIKEDISNPLFTFAITEDNINSIVYLDITKYVIKFIIYLEVTEHIINLLLFGKHARNDLFILERNNLRDLQMRTMM